MKIQFVAVMMFLSAFLLAPSAAKAQSDTSTNTETVMSLPGVSLEQQQSLYTAAIENRALKAMEGLAITDPAASNRVHVAIVAHYTAVRARDEAIGAELNYLPRKSAEWTAAHAEMVSIMSQPLHQHFIARLSKDLTPEQLEKIKDKLTYGKVDFTYSGYCTIVPGLSDEDKAEILDMLKQAREVAMEGGNSVEKTAVFEQYKKKINLKLKAKGIDVEKAIQDWKEHQKAGAKTAEKTTPPSATPAN